MVTCRTPWRDSCRTTISRIGYGPIGIRGFGRTTVYGRSRVPIPPARITARSHIVEMTFMTGSQNMMAHRFAATPPEELYQCMMSLNENTRRPEQARVHPTKRRLASQTGRPPVDL